MFGDWEETFCVLLMSFKREQPKNIIKTSCMGKIRFGI